MKTLIPLLLMTLFLNAQENVSIAFYQDVKLLVSNDNHGNTTPPTLDFKIDVSLQGKQFDSYYFEIRPQFEYANLSGGKYVSWLVSGGWVFNKLINKVELSGYLTTGMIHRFDSSWLTYGLTTDLSYKIGRFKISVMPQAIKRFELENKKFGISVYGGIKYNLCQNL